jgi:hypothetical protein
MAPCCALSASILPPLLAFKKKDCLGAKKNFTSRFQGLKYSQAASRRETPGVFCGETANGFDETRIIRLPQSRKPKGALFSPSDILPSPQYLEPAVSGLPHYFAVATNRPNHT